MQVFNVLFTFFIMAFITVFVSWTVVQFYSFKQVIAYLKCCVAALKCMNTKRPVCLCAEYKSTQPFEDSEINEKQNYYIITDACWYKGCLWVRYCSKEYNKLQLFTYKAPRQADLYSFVEDIYHNDYMYDSIRVSVLSDIDSANMINN